MSLDIYLKNPTQVLVVDAINSKLRHWSRHQICETYGTEKTDIVFHWNITHNLSRMAYEVPCGNNVTLHKVLWCPQDIFGDKQIVAKMLTTYLLNALEYMTKNEDALKKYNPKNGYGHYDNLFQCVAFYYRACNHWPEAFVSISK